MCGIALTVTPNGPSSAIDLDLLGHRGPDGRGTWRLPDGSIWMGSTRLSIQDLTSSGSQPMRDGLTGNVIVYNGEIYNHVALRREMAQESHQWVGTSDTETILGAYRVWGEGFIRRLNGMFSFAIYDARSGSLLVARDRLGIKPLFYMREGNSVRFASETRALLAGHGNPQLSPASLGAYLEWGACPEELLIDTRVNAFPAGNILRLSADGNLQFQEYWPQNELAKAAGRSISRPDARVVLRELLEAAVERHMLSDVPVAVLLSGGVDSSIITALASKTTEKAISTFTVRFDDKKFDESNIAELVARRYRTDHHVITLSENEVLPMIEEAVMKMDLPTVDGINTYVVSKKIAEHGFKVALSGLGGDELFGGYPSFVDVPRLRLISRVPKRARHVMNLFGHTGERIADIPASSNVMILARFRRRFWTDAMLKSFGFPSTPIVDSKLPDLPDDFARISWAEMTGYMRHMLLRDSDQMSMAVSLELRVPLLDNNVVEFVLGLPAAFKSSPTIPKGLLVEACIDLLPNEVYKRNKMGFGFPMDRWIRGPLRSFSEEGIRLLNMNDLVSRRESDKIYQRFLESKLHWTRVWSLVVLGWYLRSRM
jgi:asparagine synthase (glutamine-hydrolysing)